MPPGKGQGHRVKEKRVFDRESYARRMARTRPVGDPRVPSRRRAPPGPRPRRRRPSESPACGPEPVQVLSARLRHPVSLRSDYSTVRCNAQQNRIDHKRSRQLKASVNLRLAEERRNSLFVNNWRSQCSQSVVRSSDRCCGRPIVRVDQKRSQSPSNAIAPGPANLPLCATSRP